MSFERRYFLPVNRFEFLLLTIIKFLEENFVSLTSVLLLVIELNLSNVTVLVLEYPFHFCLTLFGHVKSFEKVT